MYKLQERKHINLLVLLCTAVYFVSYITRINYGAVMVEIISNLKITNAAASLAVTGSAITYGAGQLVSGYLGDKLKPHRLIACGLVTTAAMNILLPFLNYRYMVAAWCVNGLAQAMMWPPIVKIMTTYLNIDDYKRGTVKISWGSSFGTIAVYLFSPVIISASGWKSVFFISALLAVIMTIILLVFFGKITSHAVYTEVKSEVSTTEKQQKTKSAVPVMLMFALVAPGIIFQGILRDGITTWMPTYISDTYNLGSSVAILTGVILPIFSILCYQVASWLNRKVIKNELSCAAAIFAASCVASVLLIITNSKSAVLSVLLSAAVTGCMHGVNVMQTCMVPPYFAKHGKVSLMSGMLNSCTYIGAAISGYGTAVISDIFAWNGTVIAWAIAALLGTVLCLAPSKIWTRFKDC